MFYFSISTLYLNICWSFSRATLSLLLTNRIILGCDEDKGTKESESVKKFLYILTNRLNRPAVPSPTARFIWSETAKQHNSFKGQTGPDTTSVRGQTGPTSRSGPIFKTLPPTFLLFHYLRPMGGYTRRGGGAFGPQKFISMHFSSNL